MSETLAYACFIMIGVVLIAVIGLILWDRRPVE